MIKKDVFKEAGQQFHSVWLQKFSATTYVPDAKDPHMHEDMLKALSENPKLVSRVWRAKIGRQRRWHYAFSPGEALEKALHGGGEK